MYDKWESFLSIVPVGVVVVNKNRKIVSMNPYARDVILSEEFFGTDVLELHDVEGKNKILDAFSKLSENKAVELPIVKILDFKDKSMFLEERAKNYFQRDRKTVPLLNIDT